MSKPLWSQSDLHKLTGHRKPIVRQWACERMMTLYGEEGLEVLNRLLRDKDKEVLMRALGYLERYPNPKFKDIVLKIYQTQAAGVAQRAALLLGKLKDERLITSYEKKVKAGSVAFGELISVVVAIGRIGTDQAKAILREMLSEMTAEMDSLLISSLIQALLEAKEDISILLEFYGRHYKKFAMEILYPFTSICGSLYSLEDMREREKKRIIGKNFPYAVLESLSYIRKMGFTSLEKDLHQAFKKESYRQVIEMAWHQVEKAADGIRPEAGDPSFFDSYSPPLVNFTVLKAFKDFSSNCPIDSLKVMAIATLVILSKFIEFSSLLGLKVEEISEETLLRTILEDRDTVKSDDILMERLLIVGNHETIFDQCLRQLKYRPYSYGTERAISLIGRLKDQRAIPYLLDFLKEKWDEDALDESIQALVQIGSPSVNYLEKNFDRLNRGQISEVLFALKDIPEEKAVDLLLRHWDKLWSISKEPFLYALEGIASKKFIGPLRKELKEGEEMEEEIFYLLCHIHGVDDLLLPKIEKDTMIKEKETERSLNALEGDDLRPLIGRTVRVELKCRQCGKSYHYEVENIYMISGEKGKPRISDKIVCKNCRAVNQYEITAKGDLAITSQMILMTALTEKGKIRPEESPIKFGKSGLMDGRRMSFDDVLKYYKEEIKKSPNDPALRIGYGNVLMKTGREGEAILHYQEALRLDPLAVEAYCCLGEYEGDKGNPSRAYEYFKKASDHIHTGHYYRIKEPDQLKEAIIFNLEHFEEVLGKEREEIPGPASQEIIKKDKAGRNDPCPCGSGKKYKRCCLGKDEVKRPVKTSATPKEIELRDRLVSFSAKERHKKDFEKAYQLFWRRPFKEPLELDEKEEANFASFLEWFIHDFSLWNGLTIVEEFYQEKKGKLSEEELSLLKYEMLSYLSLYEVTSVTPEVGLRLKDLFTGEEMDIFEVKGSLTAVKWDVIFVRVISMGAVNKLSGIVTLIPRRSKENVLLSIKGIWEKFKSETGNHEWSYFVKSNAHLIHHLIEDQSLKEPVFVTEEYHRICSSKAVFDVKNFDTIRYRLGHEFDFIIDEEKGGKRILFTWLKRGASKHWEIEKPPEDSVILRSEMIRGKGELRWTSLGTVTLTPKRLELRCLSKERLDQGKKRLFEILGDDIQHRIDTYEDLVKKAMESSREAPSIEEDEMPEKFYPLFSKTMGELVTKWIDEKIPALDGRTPREAVKTSEGREKVEELLKDWENMEERKRKDGELYIDINILRQMLNL